jgi:hypothetical protein
MNTKQIPEVNRESKAYRDGFASGKSYWTLADYWQHESNRKAMQGIGNLEPGIRDYWIGWLAGKESTRERPAHYVNMIRDGDGISRPLSRAIRVF